MSRQSKLTTNGSCKSRIMGTLKITPLDRLIDCSSGFDWSDWCLYKCLEFSLWRTHNRSFERTAQREVEDFLFDLPYITTPRAALIYSIASLSKKGEIEFKPIISMIMTLNLKDEFNKLAKILIYTLVDTNKSSEFYTILQLLVLEFYTGYLPIFDDNDEKHRFHLDIFPPNSTYNDKRRLTTYIINSLLVAMLEKDSMILNKNVHVFILNKNVYDIVKKHLPNILSDLPSPY